MKRAYSYVLFLFICLGVMAADFTNPTERIKDSVGKVLIILKDESLQRELRWEKIGSVIDQSFDFRSMSQSILATNWKTATPSEREKFIEFFSQYLEETYRAKIEAYTNQKVEYIGETINGKRAVVETLIITDSTKIPVNYKLKNNDGIWFAYDVVIEGISLVSNYRSTFAAIVKNDGMDGLINDIQLRINKYKSSDESSFDSDTTEDS